jgi:hypothetical protein
MPIMSAADCQIFGKMIEKPTSDGNVKSMSERRALERDPRDLASTINAGIKSNTRKRRIINMVTPKSNLKQC